ncbi:MAG: UDP-N-acetylmuramoyl-tripeptide--D-alanyl-D-alanine ligase [Chloroflexi bacterium]|nr:UDP-N-acetylmuramoyl-tripeptide--D-alanyl-D-alanine ligase [Chloroflexota bacterium]
MNKKLTLSELVYATQGTLVEANRAALSLEKLENSFLAGSSNVAESFHPAKALTLASLAGTLTFEKVVYDSREVSPGTLFVALPGELTDGHRFIEEALVRGATALLVRESWLAEQSRLAEGVYWVAVPDTLLAFQKLAAYWRKQFPSLQVIGITGSVGKTSTKELVASLLEQRYHILKSPKSVNTEQSMLPVLLQLQTKDEYAVLEMGAGYVLGELERLCSVAKPRLGLVLNVSHSHLARMGSLENIARSKAELVSSLPSAAEGGIAILNGDDPLVKAMADLTLARPFYYGLQHNYDLWADEIETFGLEGIAFTAHYQGQKHHLRLPLLGRHNVYTALAAAAVGLTCNLSWAEIEAGLQNRQALVRLVALPGLNGSTIIDDRYNASAVSTLAALNLLAEAKVVGRKLAVLGDMFELGSFAEEAHQLVGRRAAEVVDKLAVIGTLAQTVGRAAFSAGLPASQIIFAVSKDEIVEWLKTELAPGDYLLIKASRGMMLEDIVERVRAK